MLNFEEISVLIRNYAYLRNAKISAYYICDPIFRQKGSRLMFSYEVITGFQGLCQFQVYSRYHRFMYYKMSFMTFVDHLRRQIITYVFSS